MTRLLQFLVLALVASVVAWGCSGSTDDGGSTGGGPTSCQAGTTWCGSGCVDISSNPAHCSQCNWQCLPGMGCTNGQCTCAPGQSACDTGCADVNTDASNCGQCGRVCGVGQMCVTGQCGCAAGRQDCGAGCIDVASDPANCGACGLACAATEVCSLSQCKVGCDAGLMQCGQSCIDINTDIANCGGCGTACGANQACTGGACACTGGLMLCADGTCKASCESTTCEPPMMQCPDGTCQATCPPPVDRDCPTPAGLISDFEEGPVTIMGDTDLPVIAHEDRTGFWGQFNDGAGTQTTSVEQVAGGAMCNQYALHTRGSGHASYVGISVTMRGEGQVAEGDEYDATSRGFTGVKFRAWTGAGHASPVRFSVASSFTEQVDTGGNCEAGCYNHVGAFLYNEGNTDQLLPAHQITSTPKEFTICFDRDLNPLFLPSPLTVTQRNTTPEHLLKFQFQFNNGKNMTGRSPADITAAPEYDKALPYDLWVDDLQFVSGECGEDPASVFTSSAGTATPFPRNGDLGSCAAANNSEAVAARIARAYLRWKAAFVSGGNKVISPEQSNAVTSESMGYGMLISAAMGDKETFDAMMGYVNGKLTNGLMHWQDGGGGGTATDGDADIAYALLVAAAQWGGGSYASTASSMIGAMASQDVVGGRITAGSSSHWTQTYPNAFNASYHTPAWYPAFTASNSAWGSNIESGNYSALTSCDQGFGGLNGLVPDWCNASNGSPNSPEDYGAQVTNMLTCTEQPNRAVFGFDASRTPWRVGQDACLSPTGAATDYVGRFIQLMLGKTGQGQVPQLMPAGTCPGGGDATGSIDNQMSFIGPMGVAAMGAGNDMMRDGAFLAVLDIMESPEFNRTYYPTTLGMITLLDMSGNYPHP